MIHIEPTAIRKQQSYNWGMHTLSLTATSFIYYKEVVIFAFCFRAKKADELARKP